MSKQHKEFIDIINKWGWDLSKVRIPSKKEINTCKVDPWKKNDFVDITHHVEISSANQRYIEGIYGEYI